MKRRLSRIALAASLVAIHLFQVSPPAQAANVTFSQTFTSGEVPAASILTAWQTFVSQLSGTYGSFTFSSSNGGSITVSDPTKITELATALRSRTSTSDATYTVTIGGEIWQYTPSYNFEFGNNSYGGCGNPKFVIRPTFSNANWGGVGTTCSSATQTMTLTFTESAPTATTFATSQTSPTNISTNGTVTYSLTMSQSVTGLAAADFQFGGTSSCDTPVVSGSGTTYTITVTNCSEGNLILQLKANSVTGTTTTGPAAITSANTIVIDRTAPAISSVTGPTNSTYAPGNNLDFIVNTNETVTVTGNPQFMLVIGSTARYASYVSGSNSRALTFRYTVAASVNDIDTDGVASFAPIALNAGSILDLATNSMSNFGFTPPNTSSVLVAQRPQAPVITAITPSNAALSVTFGAGAANGSAITNYKYSLNGATFISAGTTTSPIAITGLTNGTSYSVRLLAVNAIGDGDSSTAVIATPSAVVLSGNSTLVTTYGISASTGTYTATGGTGGYSYTLSATPSGVSISGGVVTVSSSTPAGVYTQNVIATDSTSQIGTRALTITVNKASTSISISLPNSSTTAAASGAVTITATVSRAGTVNFQLGGSTISGCGTATAASTTATCAWTAPGSLGNVTLTAIFTPTDTSNFETSTTTSLVINVVNGVSTVSLSLAGGTLTPEKGKAIVITAVIDQAGRITFTLDGKRIPSCFNRLVTIGSATCSWKPTTQRAVTIRANLIPTNNVFQPSSSALVVQVGRRTGTR